MFGGGVKGGSVFGATDHTGGEVTDNAITIPDFNATIGLALGLPLDEVVTAPNGRPFRFADKGKPVTSIFA